MAWTAPMTAVANTAFTASQFNTHVRDNLLETVPAKATAAYLDGAYPVKIGTNQISMRTASQTEILTAQSTTSTSYANLSTAGPSMTKTTGTTALVLWHCTMTNNSANSNFMSVEVSGATTDTNLENRALRFRETETGTTVHLGTHFLFTTLTPGSNTFQAKYRVFGGTGTFSNRRITVIPF